MSIVELKSVFFNKSNLCAFFGHKFITTRNVTNHFKEYKCTVCELELTNDDKGHAKFLTPELREINETLMHLYTKRNLAKVQF
jgi:hypothetical protein